MNAVTQEAKEKRRVYMRAYNHAHTKNGWKAPIAEHCQGPNCSQVLDDMRAYPHYCSRRCYFDAFWQYRPEARKMRT